MGHETPGDNGFATVLLYNGIDHARILAKHCSMLSFSPAAAVPACVQFQIRIRDIRYCEIKWTGAAPRRILEIAYDRRRQSACSDCAVTELQQL